MTRAFMQHQPPSAWRGTGDEWRMVPGLALLALSEHMGRRGSNRDSRDPISDETRGRFRQASLSAANRDLQVADAF